MEKLIVCIQKIYKGYKMRKRMKILRSTESIKMSQFNFNQEGEAFLVIIMKKLLNNHLTAYCLNLNTKDEF